MPSSPTLCVTLVLLGALLGLAEPSTRPAPPAAVTAAPRTVDDLRQIQSRVQEVIGKVTPATVGVMLGPSQGSGVIVSKDGIVLTAGHVAREPNLDVALVLADGRRVKGKTLGINRTVDGGMIRITTPGEWPFVEVGRSADLRPGHWCIAMGHPGGYRRDRPPVLRLGRVLVNSDRLIDTDCTLVGGDSGGPLFDLNGRVIGINSRIGASAQANIHVPIDTFTVAWDRMLKGEAWGAMAGMPAPRGPMLGISGEDHAQGCRVTAITPGSPAQKVGLKAGDVIWRFEDQDKPDLGKLVEMIGRKKVGDEVKFSVLRGDQTLQMAARLASRP
jgi:serine protease Do